MYFWGPAQVEALCNLEDHTVQGLIRGFRRLFEDADTTRRRVTGPQRLPAAEALHSTNLARSEPVPALRLIVLLPAWILAKGVQPPAVAACLWRPDNDSSPL